MAESFTSLDVLNSIQLLGMVLRYIPLSESEKENEFTYVVNFESALENELQVISVDSSKKSFRFDYVFRPRDSKGKLEPVKHLQWREHRKRR